ncbi:MAG: competence/damage-inducible protein A [Salinirussus sp.]
MEVALVTVGDEILAGDTVNTNAAWLGERLAERGVDVERITVVPDRIADIARVVNEYRAEFDAVIVTGGLGPTHDDVTMEGVAAAVGTDVVDHEGAREWLAGDGYTASDLAEGTTHLPRGAELLPNPEGVAPGCVIDGIYVLPGVPDEMKAMWNHIADEFSGVPRHRLVVEAAEPESALIDRFREIQERFDVRVGSYPDEVVRIKLEGATEEVEAAAAWLRERVERPD